MATRLVSRPPRRLAAWLSSWLLVALAACGGGSEPTVDNTPATITATPPGPLTVPSGTTTTIAAAVKTKSGTVLSSAPVTWTSSDQTVALVSNGTVTGVKAGTATITATSGTLTTQVSVTVTPGAATQLVIATQPVGAVVGSPLATQPVVEIHDAAGNLVPTSTAAVTAAIATGGGTLTGTTTANAVGGVATFTNLAITGSAGTRTLTFSSPGLASATSSEFTMQPPPVPIIVVDSATFSVTSVAGSNAATHTVTITNGGGGPFTSVTVDPVVYDANQPTGWLNPVLVGGVAPFKLSLTFASTTLAPGTYHAIVRINAPGAQNTPVTISVTLTVVPAVTVTYGAATERMRILDLGASFSPAAAASIDKAPQPISAITFTSRATSVVTVDATGKITAVGPGQGWVVASLQGSGDSVFVSVTRSAAGPVLRADLTNWLYKPGDTLIVNFTLDPRATPVAGATVAVGYETENSMFTVLGATIPQQTPMPTGAFTSPGVIKVSVASADALTGPVVMVQLRLIARSAGLSGFLTFTALDIVGPDGADKSSITTSTRYPVVIR